jgi:RNA-directed DNA polymerase
LQGRIRNRRDPSARPSSGQIQSHKPEAKAKGVQRESEGPVVPSRAVQHNAAGGKGPWGERIGIEGKREGMPSFERANHPRGIKSTDKVRQLRNRLWMAAKRHPGRRFHALYDRIHRGDILRAAWKAVRANKGAAGVDGESIKAVEERGVEPLLEELSQSLREGKYCPKAVLRRYIPKPDGRQRPLGIPAVRDRIVQMAAKLVLEPVFEADFKDCSYGFRPHRNATEALEALRKRAMEGGNHVLDADIKDYFGSINQELLLRRVALRVSDTRVLKLLRLWLEAGVMEEGALKPMLPGVPQGGVISPLLSNVYLDYLDTVWQERCGEIGQLVRYADDFVVQCKSRTDCREARRRIEIILSRLKLELHPEKSGEVDLSWGRQGFDFLGCHLRRRMSGMRLAKQGKRVDFLHRWPSQRSMKRVRSRVRELTQRRANAGRDIRDVILDLNPILQGWGNYFRTGNATVKFLQVDTYVWKRLRRLKVKAKGRNLRPGQWREWTREYFYKMGLKRLRGTVRYPERV